MAEPAQNPKAKPDAAPAEGSPMLIVRGPAGGRWRAGKFFTAEPQTLDAGKLTAAEIAEIEGDPVLSVKRG